MSVMFALFVASSRDSYLFLSSLGLRFLRLVVLIRLVCLFTNKPTRSYSSSTAVAVVSLSFLSFLVQLSDLIFVCQVPLTVFLFIFLVPIFLYYFVSCVRLFHQYL